MRLFILLFITASCSRISTDAAYLGCYKEYLRRRNFAKNPGALKVSEVTPASCYVRCGGLGYLYAGLGNGFQCFCASTAPGVTMTMESDGKCNVNCTGDPNQMCGSPTHISVYDAVPPMFVSVSASSNIVQTGVAVTLTPSVSSITGLVSSYALRLMYEDESTVSHYTTNGVGLLSRTYNLAGEYSIKTYATTVNQELPDAVTETGVVVHSAVSGVRLDCTNTMATHEPDSCVVEVIRGTDMSVTFDYTDGAAISKTFPIADAIEAAFGNSPMANLDIANTTFLENMATGGLFLLSGNSARTSGRLAGIEYAAVNSGTITVGIYRPACTDYCYAKNECGGCTQNTCSSPSTFCTDLESCCDVPTVKEDLVNYNLNFQIKKDIAVSAGFQYIDLSADKFEVRPGDMLVLEVVSGNNLIAVIEDHDAGNLTDMFCPSLSIPATPIGQSYGCTGASGKIHQIRAVYSKPSNIKLPLEFTNAGTVTMTATVSNRQISGTSQAINTITVIDGVNFAIFDLPTCLESGVQTTLSLLPFTELSTLLRKNVNSVTIMEIEWTGTSVNILWTFGDLNSDTVSTAPLTEVQHQYAAPGTYELSVNISNVLSFKYNSTTVCVQEKITNMVYNVPLAAPGIVAIGVDHVTNIIMSKGSDYTCDITFNFADGTSSLSSLTDITGPSLIVSFTIPGSMTITTHCYNSISESTHILSLKAVEQISGVALERAGAMKDYAFQFIIEWLTGSGIQSLDVKYDSNPTEMTIYQSDRRALSGIKDAEETISSHTIDVSIANELGTVSVSLPFTIEEPVSEVVLSCTFQNQLTATESSDYTVIDIGSYVECRVSVASGTNVEFHVDWDEVSSSPYTDSKSDASSWDASTIHYFDSPQICNISVSLKNSLTEETKYYPILVTVGVDGIFLNNVPFVIFTPPAEVTFTWNTTGVTHIPIGVTCNMFWGDNNNNTFTDCNLTQPLTHTYYDEDGILNLTYTLSNVVSSLPGWITVEVISPIKNMVCLTSPVAFQPAVAGQIMVKFARAPGPGVLDLDFDCDTSVPGLDLTRKRLYESPDGEDDYNCTFSSTGIYTYSITARSVSETKTCNQTVKVLNPVTEHFNVLNNAPVDYDFMKNCSVVMKIDYTGSPLPDEAFILYDFGDGNIFGPVPFAAGYQLNHEYAGPGHFISNVTIYNDASAVSKIFNSGCYEKFKDVSMTVMRKPVLPLDIEDQVPLGTNANLFLVDDEVKIHMDMSAGTIMWWEITAISGTKLFSCNTTETSILSISITEIGSYNLSVLPKNILFSGPLVSQTIGVVSPVSNIAVSDQGTTDVNQPKQFEISMEKYGTDMCVKVTNGYVDSPMFYGTQITCTSSTDYVLSNYVASVNVSQAFTLTYTYPEEGTYNLTVEAWTDFSYASKTFQFPISSVDCGAPKPTIKQSRTFLYPITFYRNKRIKLVATTNANCNYGLRNTKLWLAALWDRNNNTKIADLDLTNIPSYNHSELSIPPLGLEYGVYRFTYKIVMEASGNSGEEFSGSDETFIEVIPSDLVVQVSKSRMYQWTVGPATLLNLAPIENSYDPDSDTSLGMDNTLDTFMMSCRDVTNISDTFVLPLSNETIVAYNLTELPSSFNAGGCFNQGTGWLVDFQGSLIINTTVLTQGHTYEFFVNGTRNITRFSNDTVRIKVVHDVPPEFNIGNKVKAVFTGHPEGQMFNANSQLGLIANVTSQCDGCNYTYEWKMFAYDYRYCDLDTDRGCWRELTYLPIYIEGVNSDELTIKTAVFIRYNTVDKFQVQLIVTDPVRDVSGEVYLSLIRNRPPYGGQCHITPTTGVAFNELFKIRCENFMDDNQEIASYKIYCDGQAGSVAGGLHNGNSAMEWSNMRLPAGDDTNNYTLSCQVTVTDALNAAGVYDMDPVIVVPPPVNDIRDVFAKLRNQTADEVDVVESNANLDDTCSLVSSVVSLTKISSTDDENLAYSSVGAAVSYRRTQFGETGSRTNPFQELESNRTKKREYETYRDNAGTLVKQVTNILEKCTVESPDDATLLAKTLDNLSQATVFIGRESQSTITGLVHTSLDAIMRNVEGSIATVEDVEEAGGSCIKACANIQEAAVLSANHPMDTDVLSQKEPVAFFVSNHETSMADVKYSDNAEEQLEDGMKIYNKIEQKKFIASNLADCDNIKNEVISMLTKVKTKSKTPKRIKSSNVDMSTIKNDPEAFNDATIENDVGNVHLPNGILESEDSGEPMVLSVLGQVSSGETDEDNPMNPMAGKVSIKFQYPNGTKKQIKNLAKPINLGIKNDPYQSNVVFDDLELVDPEIHEGFLFNQRIEVTQINSAIKLTYRPTNITSTNQLLVIVSYGEMLTSTIDPNIVKKTCMIPSHTSQAGKYGGSGVLDPYSCFIEADIVAENIGMWYFGVRQLIIPELNLFYSKDYLPNDVPLSWLRDREFVQNYKIKSAVVTCVYTEDGSNVVHFDGVKPTAFSTETEIACEAYHLTTFSGSFAVAPNTIDWNFIFSNADFLKNPTLYITEILILLLYVMAMIWARRQDKQDVTKLGLAPLLDNDQRDKYYYEIMVNTGMRRNAGTESKVHFILSGEEEETDVRTFTDKKRKIMQRGNNDGFLMAVPSCLGALNYLRLWHDNSGRGKMASWYLNYIVIRDVQTDRKYYFIANRWFAVEEDDGQVDRVVPVAGKEQMTEFSHLFAERASKNLSDGHLWFSVFARPPQSRFTRCQRVSCCLCLLYVSMLANAMFYELANSNSSAFSLGPFAFSLEQIYVGVVANIIIFPVNFLIMTLFRKSRPRKLRPSRVEEALKSNPQRTTSMTDVNPRVKSSMDGERPGSSFLIDAKRSESSMSRPYSSMAAVQTSQESSKGKKKCQLPWWCVIVAWVLLWLTVLVSAAFVTFYGIMFQDTKCRKWITSLLISFFTSIFFTQPIKVFLFAIVFSLIIRKPENDQDEDDDEEPRKQLETDEEFLFNENEDYSLVGPQRPQYKPKPPNAKVLEAARQQRLKELQMWSVIREIIIYAFFLWILMVISYRSVSSNSYNYKHNMEKVFITTNDTKHAFNKVKNVEDFWVWAKTGMLRGLRAGPYYNNFPPFYLRGYINDKVSRIMGHAVLRQVRIQPGSCTIPSQVESVIDECNAPYEILLEESRSFLPNWTDIGNSNVSTREEYTYQDANSLEGYPYWGDTGVLYSGGGYVYRLNKDYFTMLSDFNKLESERWVDEYTRAVFLEFTVYNPSINLFAVSTLVSEFRPSGGVMPSYRFEPCNLLPYMSGVLIFQVICEIVYLIFTLCFIVKEIRNIYKQKMKYFLQFWNIIDFSICAMSVSAIVIYFYRLICINRLSEYFAETNGNGYMKFQYVGYWSELFNYMIGFLVFFSSMKFLKLLRFNKRISLLADTLKNSAKDLIHFSIIFNIVFLAFVQAFYLVYHSHLDIFKTFMSSCEAGIVMMMGKFDIYNMSKVNQWFTQIFLFLFVVTITFIVVNMFLSILNDTFGSVRGNLAQQQNDYEIVDFMMNRFKVWTGMGRNNSATITPAEMEAERARNYQTLEGQIDYFPNQIDRFLASISNMYMEKSKFDDFLHKGAYGKMMAKAQAQDPHFAAHPAPSHTGTLRLSSGVRGMTDVQTD